MFDRLSVGLSEIRQDLAFALRTTVFTPGFAAASVTLGTAVGAVAAVYGTADWLLARPPTGVVEPERIVELTLGEVGRPDLPKYGFSYPQYVAFEEIQDAFDEVAAYAKVSSMVATEDDGFEEAVTQWVTGSYFPLLGIEPHLGRLITPDDDFDGAPGRVVISQAYWRTRLGSRSDVIGSTLRFGPDVVTVIGVLPPEFEDSRLDWNGPTQVWFPMGSASSFRSMAGMLTMRQTFFRVLGRLPADRTHEQAVEMAQRWPPDLPELSMTSFEPNLIEMRSLSATRIGRRDQARSFLAALVVVSGLVLLAAAASVANFLLGRAGRRRAELALRAALGASRGRLGRQLVTESTILAGATAVVAAVSAWGVAWVLAPLPRTYLDVSFRHEELTTLGAIDGGLLTRALLVGCAATLLIGVLPVFGTFRDPAHALKASGPAWGWGRFRFSLRHGVLTAQIGLTVLLAATATMFGRSFAAALDLPAEYRDPSSLMIARVRPVTLSREESGVFFRTLLDRVREDPQVRSATISVNPPFAGAVSAFARPGSDDRPLTVPGATGGPGYFAVHGTPVVAGTDFGDFDDSEVPGTLVVNQAFADHFWPGEEAVGRTIEHNGNPVRIRGVVERRRCADLVGPGTMCYWSWASADGRRQVFRVRTAGEAQAFIPRFREIVEELGSDIAVTGAEGLDDFLAYQVRAEHFAAWSSAALALFGVLLLAGGTASLFVSLVRGSLGEIAIRVALGATDARVARHILSHGAAVMAAGIVLGLVATRFVAPRFAERLFEVAPSDPLSYSLAAAIVATVGLAAMGSATRTAASSDPSTHLRSQ